MAKRDHALGQQRQRAAAAPVGRLRAGQGDEVGLQVAVELGLVDAVRAPVAAERRLKALLDEAPTQALHRRQPDVLRLRDTRIAPSWPALGLIGFQQDLRVLKFAHVGFAAGQELAEGLALLRRQRHAMLLHGRPPISAFASNRKAAFTSSLIQY